jgi:hypothetical protein
MERAPRSYDDSTVFAAAKLCIAFGLAVGGVASALGVPWWGPVAVAVAVVLLALGQVWVDVGKQIEEERH